MENLIIVFLKTSNTKTISKFSSRNTSLGAVFAERFNRTIRDLLEKTDFEKGDANWVDVFTTVTKHNKKRVQSSTELTPIQASAKQN